MTPIENERSLYVQKHSFFLQFYNEIYTFSRHFIQSDWCSAYIDQNV